MVRCILQVRKYYDLGLQSNNYSEGGSEEGKELSVLGSLKGMIIVVFGYEKQK